MIKLSFNIMFKIFKLFLKSMKQTKIVCFTPRSSTFKLLMCDFMYVSQKSNSF